MFPGAIDLAHRLGSARLTESPIRRWPVFWWTTFCQNITSLPTLRAQSAVAEHRDVAGEAQGPGCTEPSKMDRHVGIEELDLTMGAFDGDPLTCVLSICRVAVGPNSSVEFKLQKYMIVLPPMARIAGRDLPRFAPNDPARQVNGLTPQVVEHPPLSGLEPMRGYRAPRSDVHVQPNLDELQVTYHSAPH